MTVTDTTARSAYMADLDKLQAQIEQARRLAVPEGTRAHGTLHLSAPSAEGADAIAGQWGTEPEWTENGRQYRATDGDPTLGISVAYHPNPLRLVSGTAA